MKEPNTMNPHSPYSKIEDFGYWTHDTPPKEGKPVKYEDYVYGSTLTHTINFPPSK